MTNALVSVHANPCRCVVSPMRATLIQWEGLGSDFSVTLFLLPVRHVTPTLFGATVRMCPMTGMRLRVVPEFTR
jgi:hypothetical protein